MAILPYRPPIVSLHWMWPGGRARKFHCFINGEGISMCRWYSASEITPARREMVNCLTCERELRRHREAVAKNRSTDA